MTFEKNPLRHHLALWAGFLSSFDDLYVRYHISEIGSKRLILKKYVSLQNEQSRIKYLKIIFFFLHQWKYEKISVNLVFDS